MPSSFPPPFQTHEFQRSLEAAARSIIDAEIVRLTADVYGPESTAAIAREIGCAQNNLVGARPTYARVSHIAAAFDLPVSMLMKDTKYLFSLALSDYLESISREASDEDVEYAITRFIEYDDDKAILAFFKEGDGDKST